MASLNLDDKQFKQLELARNRLFHLCNNLESLKNTIAQGDPLPTPDSLQNQANIIGRNLAAMDKVLKDNHALFSRIAVHPSTNFPGRTQEGILQQLLRKKLEPELEDWVEESRRAALAAGLDASKLGGGGMGGAGGGDDEDYRVEQEGHDGPEDPLTELWKDAEAAYFKRFQYYLNVESQSAYTEAEKAIGTEKIRTGLKRNLDEDEDEESDEEVDDGADNIAVGAGMGGAFDAKLDADVTDVSLVTRLEPEYLQCLAARGDLELPANLRMEIQRRLKAAAKPPGMAQ